MHGVDAASAVKQSLLHDTGLDVLNDDIFEDGVEERTNEAGGKVRLYTVSEQLHQALGVKDKKTWRHADLKNKLCALKNKRDPGLRKVCSYSCACYVPNCNADLPGLALPAPAAPSTASTCCPVRNCNAIGCTL